MKLYLSKIKAYLDFEEGYVDFFTCYFGVILENTSHPNPNPNPNPNLNPNPNPTIGRVKVMPLF